MLVCWKTLHACRSMFKVFMFAENSFSYAFQNFTCILNCCENHLLNSLNCSNNIRVMILVKFENFAQLGVLIHQLEFFLWTTFRTTGRPIFECQSTHALNQHMVGSESPNWLLVAGYLQFRVHVSFLRLSAKAWLGGSRNWRMFHFLPACRLHEHDKELCLYHIFSADHVPESSVLRRDSLSSESLCIQCRNWKVS